MNKPLPVTGHAFIVDDAEDAALAIHHVLDAPHHRCFSLPKTQLPPFPPANMQIDCILHYMATALDIQVSDTPSFHLLRMPEDQILQILDSRTDTHPGIQSLRNSLQPDSFLAVATNDKPSFLDNHSQRIELALKSSLAVPLTDFLRKGNETGFNIPILIRHQWTCSFAIPPEYLDDYIQIWDLWLRISRKHIRPFPFFFGRHTLPFTTHFPNGNPIAVQSFSAPNSKKMLSAIRKIVSLGIPHHPDSHPDLTDIVPSRKETMH